MFDCKGCGLPKQDDQEYKWRPNWCKNCAAKARKEYRDKNIEKYRAIARRSSTKHGEKYAQRSKCYTAALRDLREAHKAEFESYYEKHLADLQVELKEESEPTGSFAHWVNPETREEAVPVEQVEYEQYEKPRYAIDL